MSRLKLAHCLVPFVLLATTVSSIAATVNPLQGVPTLNRGDGFKPVGPGTPANSGDRVMTDAASRAEVVFNNDCRIVVEPNQSLVIPNDPPCQAAAYNNGALLAGGLAVAAGVGAVIVIGNDKDKPKPASP